MKKRILSLFVASMMMTTALVGCGATEEKAAATTATTTTSQSGEQKATPVSLKIWTSEEDYELTEKMCADFDAAHTEFDCQFEITIINVDESVDQLETDPDNAADVFIMPSGSIPQLVDKGLIYPITYDKATLQSLYSEGALEACTREGELYGVPFTPNSWFMYYNKQLFDENDIKSLEGMLAKDLGTAEDGTAIKNFSCDISNSWYIEAWFYAAGCTLFGENGDDPNECSWNNAAGLATGKYLIDMVNNSNYVEEADGIAGSLFKEGKLGALCSGTWSYPELKEVLGDNLGAAALPTVTISGKTANLSNFADYKCFAVKSNTAYGLAAQQLAEYFANEESQLARYQKNATPPTVLSLQSNADVASDIATAALLAQTKYSVAQPAISQIGEYWTPVQALGEGIVNSVITEENLQESLDSVVESVTSKLIQ